MDAVEQIRQFKDFLESHYKEPLLKAIREGKNWMVVDFSEITRFNPELADELLEKPEDVIAAAEEAVKDTVNNPEIKKFNIRFRDLPESQNILVRNIRSQHINKFVVVRGIVRQKSDVRPQVTIAKFECPSCGQVIVVPQLDTTFKEPSRCGCGRKGKFRLLDKELVDAQRIVLEEDPELLEGGEQPKRLGIFLKDDLVSPLSEKKTNPGSKIIVVGQIKEIPIISSSGIKSTRSDLQIEANYVESVSEDFYEVVLTEEEEKQIIDLGNDPHIQKKLVDALAPSIYGHDVVKESLILQLVGGCHKERTDGMQTRGDIHILLVGDPGAGKSQLLKRVHKIAPKGRYVSGKGVSGAGLTASVVKDEFLKGWSLEAGALVLASNGLCCIDEMDKMGVEDRAAMHEALEQQTISISKANIQATLLARTTVLAAANPKLGRFNPYEVIAKQIDLPPTLINRFDLIFPIKDLPDKDKDGKIAQHILGLHQNPDQEIPILSTDILRKYIIYARQKINPKLTDGALEELKEYYVQMRNSGATEEGAARAIPISARQLEALVRLSEATAKMRLGDKVTRKDAKRAIELLQHCLGQVGLDPETGKIDIDRITTGVTASQRSKIMIIKEVIDEVENKIGKTIPVEELVKAAAEKGITERDIEEAVEQLKRSGDLYEPKLGFISKI